jgi:hypothetical protein
LTTAQRLLLVALTPIVAVFVAGPVALIPTAVFAAGIWFAVTAAVDGTRSTHVDRSLAAYRAQRDAILHPPGRHAMAVAA